MTAFGKDDQLTKYLSYAFAFHVFALILMVLINQLIGMSPFKVNFKKDINIVKSAVQIDVVALPKHTLKELEKIDLTRMKEPEVEVKNDPANETSDVEFKTTKKKINMKNLLKSYSTKTIKTKKNKPKKITSADLNKIILEGNKLSKGSSTTGDNIDESQAVFVSYIQSLPDKIRPNWKLPSYLMDKEFRCRIRIFIAANGKILKTRIYESSGEQEFDQKALLALKRSSPLPIPDKSIVGKLVKGEVILGFPL